jgi:hypothetical protein
MKNLIQSISIIVLAFLISGCVLYRKPRDIDFDTNYQQDAVYILQTDVALADTGVTWSTINNARYLESVSDLFDKRCIVLPKGSRIQFKKIKYRYNPEMGRMSSPMGIILDPPAKNKTVNLVFISQEKEYEVTENLRVTSGRYINPLLLKKEKISNQILDPTWTTPVLKAEPDSQAGQD